MAFESSWSPAARRDLKLAIEQLEEIDPDAAPLVLGSVLQKIESLSESPYSGDISRKVGSREFRHTFAGKYRIFFEVDPAEQTITIHHIRHVRQQDPDFLE
jgi:plasmid stabilization system protein ParE